MADDVELEDLDGVGGKTAERLREEGLTNLMEIANMKAGELSGKVDGIGESAAESIVNSAMDLADVGGFETGTERYKQRQEMRKISTNSESFNELLDGGVETQSLTELYGEFGAGKTQIAHHLAVNVQRSEEEGGLGKGAIYIDTEDTFIPERIEQMAEAQDMDADEVLDNIHVARAFNSDHQMLLAEEAKTICEENDIGLIVVDSLMAHFRSEYVGRGELAKRQQKLNKHMSTLLKAANTHNVAVVLTNQVMDNPDQMFGDPTKAIGGNIVAHNCATIIYLRKGKKDTRVARLEDSPYLPEGEAVYSITDEGIIDG
ncbi:DNA repair and recombination protein RadA [Candidatus Nanohalovita haloferacivicina]|uniref:DNA repair and recombination protein RadA n=1 Tax=Candidatus Nanohalovita haloferacivicina TaxID=2978046 RepID=UPI00325FD7F2|nr:DNA repair and recombination protein RadA [Candidatus Nanohalobia archaeon BNXNv]